MILLIRIHLEVLSLGCHSRDLYNKNINKFMFIFVDNDVAFTFKICRNLIDIG